jgi:hypothetical protein
MDFVVVCTIVATIVCILALIRDFIGLDVKYFSSSDLEGVDVTMNSVPGGVVTQCATLTGKAGESADGNIWVAHRYHGNGEYVMSRATQIAGTGEWTATFRIGGGNDSGKYYDLYAFFVPADFSDFLDTLDSRSEDGSPTYIFARSLPPGVKNDPLLTVLRRGEAQECV